MSEANQRGPDAKRIQALRDSEELHRATLSSISDAVFLTDDDGGCSRSSARTST